MLIILNRQCITKSEIRLCSLYFTCNELLIMKQWFMLIMLNRQYIDYTEVTVYVN